MVNLMNTAEYQFVGNVVDYTQKNNIVDLICENALVEITIKAPEIVRVRMYPGESIPETHSYAVLPFEDDPGQISMEDSGDQLKISTEKLEISV
ncbi:DUF4968 domain-containing protein, partial [candidate division KSB1 bacterium]|nr:DUF4968 domain-containing protein [candidate division KSB1 bacterium]